MYTNIINSQLKSLKFELNLYVIQGFVKILRGNVSFFYSSISRIFLSPIAFNGLAESTKVSASISFFSW